MINTDILICPVCGEALKNSGKSLCCCNGHCYDLAKEGYVNLLRTSKNGDNVGDNRDMAQSRKSFLNKGYYLPFAEKISQIIADLTNGGTVLDVCCGEGYYSEVALGKNSAAKIYGFDISKNMVRLAAKRDINACFFVANLTSVPIQTGKIDVAYELFAPLNADEITRVLKPGGYFIYATGGKNHLLGLKKALYDTPYLNEEPCDAALPGFSCVKSEAVEFSITLNNNEDIAELLKMTPYYYHTPAKGIEKLNSLGMLTTELSFSIKIYKKDSEIS